MLKHLHSSRFIWTGEERRDGGGTNNKKCTEVEKKSALCESLTVIIVYIMIWVTMCDGRRGNVGGEVSDDEEECDGHSSSSAADFYLSDRKCSSLTVCRLKTGSCFRIKLNISVQSCCWATCCHQHWESDISNSVCAETSGAVTVKAPGCCSFLLTRVTLFCRIHVATACLARLRV